MGEHGEAQRRKAEKLRKAEEARDESRKQKQAVRERQKQERALRDQQLRERKQAKLEQQQQQQQQKQALREQQQRREHMMQKVWVANAGFRVQLLSKADVPEQVTSELSHDIRILTPKTAGLH